MARWRTLNKRAARRRARDARVIRECEEVIAKAAATAAASHFVEHVLRELKIALEASAEAMLQAFTEAFAKSYTHGWRPIDPRYDLRAEWARRHEWPEVVLEDILDADEIG